MRRVLGGKLLATLTCGGSLMLALVGISKLILRQPGETGLVAMMSIAGALLLVPLWWKRLTDQSDGLERST